MGAIELQTPDDPMGDYVIDRLVNYNNAAEGAVLPPRQQGQTRVPFVTGFQVSQSASSLAGTQFTLTWSNISSANIQVDHYAIYYTLAGTNAQQPVGPFIANQSPAQITVPNNNVQTGITFTIQTVLTNGMASDLSLSPTTAAFTLKSLVTNLQLNLPAVLIGTNGSLMLNGITWTNNPSVGVTWSTGQITYLGNTYSVASGGTGASNIWIYWQLSNPTVIQSAVSFPTLGIDDFLIGINNSFGNPQHIGYFSPVIEIHDSNNDRAYHSSGAFFIYNTAGNFVMSLSRTAADSLGTPAAGVLNLTNGSGAGGLGGGVTVNLAGSNGRIQCTDIITNGGNPFTVGNLTGGTGAIINDTLVVTIAGTTVSIPCHS